jgi:hypothetical protein
MRPSSRSKRTASTRSSSHPTGFFAGRGVQLATHAARARIASSYADRENVKAGGLMNYNIDLADGFRLVGTYTDRILRASSSSREVIE